MSNFCHSNHLPLARTVSAFLLTLMALPLDSARGQDDFFTQIDIDVTPQETNERYSLFGWATQTIGWGLEDPGPAFARQSSGLSKVETSLFAQFDYRVSERVSVRISGKAFHEELYRLRSRIDFSEGEINEFRNRYEVRDVYVEYQFEQGSYLKLGHQMINWGLSEYIRATDLINIENQYTFGQQDLEDLRLQVPALLFSHSAGGLLFDLAITHDAGRNLISPEGDEFDQFILLGGTNLLIEKRKPEDEQEYFARVSGQHDNGDFQFVLAEANDNNLGVSRLDFTSFPAPLVQLKQNRFRAAGFAANWVSGPWLAFTEVALQKGNLIRPATELLPLFTSGWDERNQVVSVAGLEYSGVESTVLTFELDNIHTQNYDTTQFGDRDQLSAGARVYWSGQNERLQLLAVWNELANDNGRVHRLSMDYDLSDDLQLGFLYVNYDTPDNSLFAPYGNNDTLQLQVQYNFQM